MKNHLSALALLSAFGCLFLSSLFPVWSTHIVGGMEDTNLFLWNAWWIHYTVHILHQSPFYTHMLFHPFGASLVSNDMSLWSGLVTESAQSTGWNVIAACNLVILLSWILAGVCTYFLVWEITFQPSVAFVCGLYVMTSSYMLARGMENWGQFNLYGIPLSLGALIRADRLKTRTAFVLAGVALAWTAACHYYFLIYSFLIVLTLDAWRLSPWRLSVHRRDSVGGLGYAFFTLAAIAGALAAWIGGLHPADVQWGSVHIGLQTPINALLVFWVFLFAGFLSRWSYRVQSKEVSVEPGYIHRRLWLYGTAFLLLSPLWIAAIHLAQTGGYPHQSILWKTHLAGANLLAPLYPNAGQRWWGPTVSHWLETSDIQPQEQAAGIGWVCLIVLAWARPWKTDVRVKRWLALAGATTVFSMGTYLAIWNLKLWMPLPFFVLRLFPVLSNVRVPERWMAVATVAWAVVLGFALTRLGEKTGRLKMICIIAGVLILVENWPGLPVVPAPFVSPVYQRLHDEPPGAVLALPLIIGDSSICVGDALPGPLPFPWHHLWAQTIHEHPILGGYIGRIPKRLIVAYKKEPFFDTLIRLEEGAPAVFGNRDSGCNAAKATGMTYVLIYPAVLRPAAKSFVDESLSLELVAADETVQLYRINPAACR